MFPPNIAISLPRLVISVLPREKFAGTKIDFPPNFHGYEN